MLAPLEGQLNGNTESIAPCHTQRGTERPTTNKLGAPQDHQRQREHQMHASQEDTAPLAPTTMVAIGDARQASFTTTFAAVQRTASSTTETTAFTPNTNTAHQQLPQQHGSLVWHDEDDSNPPDNSNHGATKPWKAPHSTPIEDRRRQSRLDDAMKRVVLDPVQTNPTPRRSRARVPSSPRPCAAR
jgi:hypothetical protein